VPSRELWTVTHSKWLAAAAALVALGGFTISRVVKSMKTKMRDGHHLEEALTEPPLFTLRSKAM